MKKANGGKRARRSFTKEFKADAVKMVLAGRSATQVAADLDLTETALREWVRRAEADAGTGSPEVLTTEERNELARLRKENKVLKMEREILKAAALHSTGRRNADALQGEHKWGALVGQACRTTKSRSYGEDGRAASP